MTALEPVTALLALVLLATLTGIELCVAAFFHPVLDTLDHRARVDARALSAARLGAVMPFGYAFAAGAAAAATAAPAFGDGSVASTGLWGLATATLIGIIGTTIVVLVPLNNHIAEGDADPERNGDHAGLDALARWDRLHRMRTAALALTVLLEIGAAMA